MIHDVEQRSPEWFALRLGKVTASRLGDVMAKTRTGYGAGRGNYMAELIVECLTGEAPERFTNAAMQWGTDQEPMARTTYEFIRDVEVSEVGFVTHDEIDGFGASPDGLIGDDGMVEIKCPNTATHLATLEGAGIDRKYLLQMQGQMMCAGRDWCDFVSFDPRLPTEMQLHTRRVFRDYELCAEIEREVRAFVDEMTTRVDGLRAKYFAPEGVILEPAG